MRSLWALIAPSGRLTRWGVVAAAVAGVATATALAAVIVFLAHDAPEPIARLWPIDLLCALVYGGVVLAMLPRSRHPAVWVIVLVALGGGLSALANQAFMTTPGPIGEGRQTLALLTIVTWLPGTYGTLAVLPWLLGRNRSRWVRAAVWVGVAMTSLALLVALTSPHPANPVAVSWAPWTQVLDVLGSWPDRACVVASALGTAYLARQWWSSRGSDDTGYGWLALGQLLMTLAFVPVNWFVLSEQANEVSGAGITLAQVFLPLSLLVVVLRQQLWGIDVTVSRVTVWSMLTGVVLGGYAVLVWLAGMLVPGSRGVAGLVAVGAVVALGQPLRFWIQERVDRLIYGHRADPVRLLTVLGTDLTDRSALHALVGELRAGLRLGGVEVRSDDGEIEARAGRLGQDLETVPLLVDGRRLGVLRVSAPAGLGLDARTRRLVQQTAGLVSVALELALVNERLRAATDRVVEVRHEERRMLRRDLHDGMGPALAGVGLGLAAAQRRLTHDPEGTARLLADLEAEVERRTEDVRLLARALLPAQLDDGDLPRALDVLADRFRTSGLVVEVDTSSLGSLDTRRQVAVYHVAAEALMNAYRHAKATSVRIRVDSVADESVVLEVLDDGEGLATERQAGVGLNSMRERTAELGGTLEIGGRPEVPGTHVTMVLP